MFTKYYWPIPLKVSYKGNLLPSLKLSFLLSCREFSRFLSQKYLLSWLLTKVTMEYCLQELKQYLLRFRKSKTSSDTFHETTCPFYKSVSGFMTLYGPILLKLLCVRAQSCSWYLLLSFLSKDIINVLLGQSNGSSSPLLHAQRGTKRCYVENILEHTHQGLCHIKSTTPSPTDTSKSSFKDR